MKKEKKCYKCEVVKSMSEFYRNKTRPDGHADQCKKCHNAATSRSKKNTKKPTRKKKVHKKKDPKKSLKVSISEDLIVTAIEDLVEAKMKIKIDDIAKRLEKRIAELRIEFVKARKEIRDLKKEVENDY